MNDSLGDRMKSQYEDRTRYFLPRRTYTLIRTDGKAFHTFTRGFDKPFDEDLINAMNSAAIAMCSEMEGAKFAYVQSDEISILLTDFASVACQAFFDGNIQKICSVSASIAATHFNKAIEPVLQKKGLKERYAYFDSRVFTIPDPVEVENYFIWRQKDWTRNSVASAAQSLYSHKELHKKSITEQQELLFQKGINWNNYPAYLKRGRLIMRQDGVWQVNNNIPIFTEDKEFLTKIIPVHSY